MTVSSCSRRFVLVGGTFILASRGEWSPPRFKLLAHEGLSCRSPLIDSGGPRLEDFRRRGARGPQFSERTQSCVRGEGFIVESCVPLEAVLACAGEMRCRHYPTAEMCMLACVGDDVDIIRRRKRQTDQTENVVRI